VAHKHDRIQQQDGRLRDKVIWNN